MKYVIPIIFAMSCNGANPYSGVSDPGDPTRLAEAYGAWVCSCAYEEGKSEFGDFCECFHAGFMVATLSDYGGGCVIPEIAESCYDWFTAMNCDDPMPPECEPSSLAVPCQE